MLLSAHGGARAAQAGCRGPRPGSGRGRHRRCRPGEGLCQQVRGSSSRQEPSTWSPAAGPSNEGVHRPGRASRTAAPPARPGGAGRRTRASELRSDRATGRRRPGTQGGFSSATSASRLRTASPTRKRSGGLPALSPNAVSSAARCGPGRCSKWSKNGAQSWCSPPNASSACLPRRPRRHRPTPKCTVSRVLQQRGLADAGLAVDNQGHASTARGTCNAVVEGRALPPPAEKWSRLFTFSLHVSMASVWIGRLAEPPDPPVAAATLTRLAR